jgi:purine-binding chemotaxis protein CheW
MAAIASSSCANGLAADSDQFLTFMLDGEEYGIDILRVQEIKGCAKIRPIPNAPPYVKGVINLRGSVVPVIDLRKRYGMTVAEQDKLAVIIVVSVGERVIGLLVDAVSDVLNIAPENIEETPEIGGDANFHGMGKVGDKLVLLLNVDTLAESGALSAAQDDSLLATTT